MNTLLHALRNTTEQCDYPYRHWLVESPLDDDTLTEMVKTAIPDVPRAYDGTRAADNGGGGLDGKLRCYIGRDNILQFPAIRNLIDELMSPETLDWFEANLGRDLNDAYLRVEVIADRKGFWLKPHTDIKEKLMSMLIYANPYNESENLGTDIYDDNRQLVKTVPYRNNLGYLFAPGDNTWHGLEKKEIQKERRSMLINYVTFKTDWKLPSRRQMRRAA
ncbi:MAG: hypothetical protein R3B91_21135 [Planctomycetaceae bacterium]